MKYLRNCWYVAAWESEVGDGLFSRRLLEESVLFYRLQSGRIAAIGNRCPHRFAPLSAGCQIGDTIQCAYHGLIFGADGRCMKNPQGDGHIPPGTGVPAYPVEVRDALIWIWMGDPALADVDRIPDLSFVTDAGADAWTGKYIHVRADYRLATDNLLDLTHAATLHVETLGKLTPSLQDGTLTVRQTDTSIHAGISMADVILPGAERALDQWLDIEWTAPGVMMLDIGHTGAGAPRGDPIGRAIHIVTPETEKTCHYFVGGTRVMGKQFKRDPFDDEDEPMLAAVQEMMGEADFWSLRPAILPTDAGAIRVRRKLDAMIRAEEQVAQ